ncbi:winged helix-turn-helix domain-containing protein [Clostridioides difficile]
MVSFAENEEQIFQQTVEWLSSKLSSSPTFIKPQETAFHIDPYTRIFINDRGESTYLTAKEFDLLYFLYCHKGQVFTKEQLYENVWGYDYVSDTKNLTSFIRKLRTKVEPDPEIPKYILTVWVVGYKFSGEKP